MTNAPYPAPPSYADENYAEPYPPGLYAPRPESSGTGAWLLRFILLGTMGVLLLLIVLGSAMMAFQVVTQGRILPNVSAMGVPLAGLTPAQAVDRLREQFTVPQDAVFTLRDPAEATRFWQFTAADLGVVFDAEATVGEAFAVGRGRGFLANAADQGLIWLNGHDAAPLVRYDQNAARAALARIAGEINRPVQDAQLIVNGLDVQTTPAVAGRTLDVNATLALLEARLTHITAGTQSGEVGGEIALVVAEQAPLTPDPTLAAAQVRAALGSPITLTATDANGLTLGPWMIRPESIGGLLEISIAQGADGTLGYNVTADVEPLRTYLESLAPGLITPSRNALYDFDTASAQLIVTQPSISEKTLDVDGTLAAVAAALFDPNPAARTIPLRMLETPAEFNDATTAAELGIRELVSQGVSVFAGSSQARLTNIQQAASRFDGLIVRPGETFSFNRYVGDISPEAGFIEGFVIVGGRTVSGVGGGVCQVSTTVYRAAFYGGYEIAERWAHGYRVAYYEDNIDGVGMDAAIYTPDLDFQFVNNTDFHLLITTDVDLTTQRLTFNFYSTNPGIRVIKEDTLISDVTPALPTVYETNTSLAPGQTLQTDWAAEGAYVTVTRVITDLAGNEIEREIIASQYQPWAAVVQVGS